METEKIILKELNKDDIFIINDLRNDWENKKMTLGVRFPIMFEDDELWYEHICQDHTNRNIYFAIKEKCTNLTVGVIQLIGVDYINNRAYIGIQIKKEAKGKGYGVDAVNLITDYAFNVLNLRKVQAEVIAYNKASLNLFEKCGFMIEAVLKEQIYFDSLYHDLYILGKIKKDEYLS